VVRKKTPRRQTRGVSKVAARQDDSAGGALLLGEEASEHEGISCSMLARTRMECGRNLIRGLWLQLCVTQLIGEQRNCFMIVMSWPWVGERHRCGGRTKRVEVQQQDRTVTQLTASTRL
jgi:hypothetical protein